jgi:hypothetical protein
MTAEQDSRRNDHGHLPGAPASYQTRLSALKPSETNMFDFSESMRIADAMRPSAPRFRNKLETLFERRDKVVGCDATRSARSPSAFGVSQRFARGTAVALGDDQRERTRCACDDRCSGF